MCRACHSDYYVKRFKTKDHLISMLFCVMAKCSSLREVSGAMLGLAGKTKHFKLNSLPYRSTLSDANKRRGCEVFEQIYYDLLGEYHWVISDSRFKDVIKKQVEIFDSSTISLFQEILKSSGRNPQNGKRKGGIKMQTVINVDESFLSLTGFTNLNNYCREIVDTTSQSTGIPVSMGVAPSKTLAKIASRFAKKHAGYEGICIIDSDEKRIKALQLTTIGDVWDIGYRNADKLQALGINTAYDFINKPSAWIRKNFTVTGERTWRELNGEPCITLEMGHVDKKSICVSRGFGSKQNTHQALKEAIATYASICAEKLRGQQSYAKVMIVSVQTSNYLDAFENKVVQFPVPTDSTLEIVHYALAVLSTIYREGVVYRKVGITLSEITNIEALQLNMFDTIDRQKHTSLMKVIDRYNSGFENSKIQLAIQGKDQSWRLRRDYLSPCFTTRLTDIIQVR